MYYIGIDFGGTNISAGIVNDFGEILAKKSKPTKSERHYSEIIADMAEVCKELLSELDIDQKSVLGIGIGSPGSLDIENGVVLYMNNVNFSNVNLKKELGKFFDMPVFIDNDANCAAFGESISGACKGKKNSVTITLGTGIGGGIIIDGKIYRGSFSCGGEIGHIVIEHNGRQCTCGRKGCFEAYCSATALVKRAEELAKKNINSILFKSVLGDVSKINPKLLFELSRKDEPISKFIVDEYIEYLADGITNIVNVFQPDIVAVGGGICNQGDYLLEPLVKLVERDVYGGVLKTKIVRAELGNDAGIVGAAMLGRRN